MDVYELACNGDIPFILNIHEIMLLQFRHTVHPEHKKAQLWEAGQKNIREKHEDYEISC
jgi:hypothetical protein